MKKITLSIFMLILMSSNGLFSSEDHSEYLEGPFETGKDVTAACLECHEEQGESFLHSVHWNWADNKALTSKESGSVALGKKTVINNFCIGISSNYPRCTSCHAGYGWKDNSFDFSDTGNIDCLVCHETTGTYKKAPAGAGIEVKGLDLEKIAQSVGPTTRETCGTCHFYGGGGNNVKHGDLEEALLTASRSLDVHMSVDGGNFACTECHKTEDHTITGSAFSMSMEKSDIVTCDHCHSANPHKSKTLNTHGKTVACQSCHIPEFARANPTKLHWDWSQAGQDITPQKDQYGKDDYNKKKGKFIWGKDVVPKYMWYNGTADRMVIGEKVDFDTTVCIIKPHGTQADLKSKIYPFKIHTGKQVADKNNKYLLTPKLWGGYWKHFDWNKALIDGAKESGLAYSGEYVFVDTRMCWRINHMVAPKEEALQCIDCHGPNQTRMDWEQLGYTNGDPRKFGKGRFGYR